MKKNIELYLKSINSLEEIFSLPKKQNTLDERTNIIVNSKNKTIINNDLLDYLKSNNISINEYLLGVLTIDLSRYSGNYNIIFSLLKDSKLIPFYKEIKENNINKFFKSIKKTNNIINYLPNINNNLNSEIIISFDTIKDLKDLYNKYNTNNIIINILIDKNKIKLNYIYNSDTYDNYLIENFFDSFFLIFKSILSNKNMNKIEYLTKRDIEFYKEVNNTIIDINYISVAKRFENVVKLNKDKLAIVTSENKLTYNELNYFSNTISYKLLDLGLKKEDIVTIILDRKIYNSIARMGIIKSGGAFLNVLPDYPDERINFILEDSKSKYIITSKEIFKSKKKLFDSLNISIIFIDELLKKEKGNNKNPNIKICNNNLCYSIYTSGSTGKPKGVLIEHRNLINYCDVNKYNKESTVITKNINASASLASFSFDVSILEEFIPLLNGGTIVMANKEEIYNPIKLAKLFKDNKVEAITCTPSFINNIIDVKEIKEAFKSIKVFNIGAEAFPKNLYKKIKNINPNANIFNGYGPTEATIGCTLKKITNDKDITIGKPMANIKIYNLDKNNNIMPVGVTGELTIIGSDVGRGYINNKKMNKLKYIRFNGEKAYKSGDTAYWNTNKEISFIGRIDNQVKINGLRIELSEIENLSNSFKGIETSVAKVIDNDNSKYICLFYTENEKIDFDKFENYLKDNLVYYMLPKKFIKLDSFPINVNGKIDRKKLFVIENNEKKEFVEPKNLLQTKLCNVMRKVLANDNLGITDNFFLSGGSSLLVMKYISYALNEGINISYKDIFNYPTVIELEKFLTNSNSRKDNSSNVTNYDYKKLHDKLINNDLKSLDILDGNKIKNIVITGCTGYLGIHILHEFLDNYAGKIYCFMRKGKYNSLLERINYLYEYYFNNNLNNFINSRLFLVEGDITDNKSFDSLKHYNIDCIINCAALVKYFDSNNIIEKTNVDGVKNIIEYCKSNKVRFIQISTTSVGGTESKDKEIIPFKENVLYFDQKLDNKYALTKFLAERLILEEIDNGLNAKIMRIGNLMPRSYDYKFQINYLDNGFLEMFRAFNFLGVVPSGLMNERIELSPVDETAKAVLLLSTTNSKYNLFHPFNNNYIYYKDIIKVMKDYGFNIKVVDDDVFNDILSKQISLNNNSEQLIGLFADLTASSEEKVVEVGADNVFTTEVLNRLGFKWKDISCKYLLNIIANLDKNKYFD